MWIDPDFLIEALGTIGLLAVDFVEAGLLVLPGDSLLFTAGLLSTILILIPVAVELGRARRASRRSDRV